MSTVASAAPRINLAAIATSILIFAALVLLLDGPIWLVKLVPTQDGPVHIAQADMIARFGWGGVLSDPAASFYQWNPRIEPNTAIYLIIGALIRLTGDALLANSIFLMLYGLLWVAAAFAVAQAQSTRPILAVLLLLPLAFGQFLHLGFYNYALGIPLFLLFAVYWRGLAGRRDARALIATAVFLLALCMTHLTAAVAACLLLAADGTARAVRAFFQSGVGTAARALVADGLWSLAAALPTLLLTATFMIAYRDLPGQPPGRLHVLSRLLDASYFFSFTLWEVVALAPLLVAVAMAALATLRQIRSVDPLWPVFLIFVLVVVALNLGTGPVSLSDRLAPLTWIGLVMTIASAPIGTTLIRALAVTAIIALAGQTAIRAAAYESWAPTLQRIITAGRSHPGDTFANVDLIPWQSRPFAWIRPTLHADQIAAVAAHGAGLSATLPSKYHYGYFPLQYVERTDFMGAMFDWEDSQDAEALSSYRRANRGAPRLLIVTSLDDRGARLANALGYGTCQVSHIDMRWLATCWSAER